MSGRSVSGGVQGLRAMFEQGNSETSPPSRGRSPAGSVTSDSSRPISKVRTSFISVERRGFSPFAVRKMSTGEGSVGGNDTTTTTTKDALTNVTSGEAPKMNGTTGGHAEFDGKGPQESVPDSTGQKEVPSVNTPHVNPDKPTTGGEETAPNTLPSDPKDENAVSDDAALEDNKDGLGSVLKGSPFQGSSDPSAEHKVANDGSRSAGPSSPIKPKSKEGKVNGQPKTPGSATKEEAADLKTKTSTPRPNNLDTKKTPSSASRAQGLKSAEKASKSPQSPQTEKPIGAPARQPLKSSSPRQTTQSKAHSSNLSMDAEKAPISTKKQSPLASKPSTAAAPKVRQTSSTTNTAQGRRGPSSQPTTKPRPKSPTRPVRLPASATAPTQASAAKHDELPSRSPSRASATHSSRPLPSTSSKTRPSASSTAGVSSRPKPSRASLPPQPANNQKPKARTSTASTRADSGSFLTRMMRPTESSAKKTHEKLEVKSPPRKSGPPKRKSDGHKESKEPQPAKSGDEELQVPEQSNGVAAEEKTQKHNTETTDKAPKSSANANGAEQANTPANADVQSSEAVASA